MAIEFWLTNDRNTERVRLPVNPDTLNVTSPFGFNDVTVANLGEVTIFGDRGLKEFSFGTFFPAHYNSSYCEYRGFKAPYTYVAIIEKWRDRKLPIRFVVTGTKINYLVTVRDFTYEVERAGNPGDIYFSITLKQFKWLPVRYEATKPATAKPKATRPPSTKKNNVIYYEKNLRQQNGPTPLNETTVFGRLRNVIMVTARNGAQYITLIKR